MKRILFSVGISAVEALGTVTRMVAIADEVRKRSPETEILFRAAGVEAEHVSKHGYRFRPGYKPPMYGVPFWVWGILQTLQGEWNGEVPPIKDIESVIRMKGIFTGSYVETSYREWEELLRTFRPDVVVSDFDFLAPVAARAHGMPLFTIFSSTGDPSYYCELFYDKPRPDRRLHRSYNRLLRRLKLPEVANVLELFGGFDHARRLIPSIPAMEDVPEDAQNRFLGSLIPEKFSGQSWAWEKRRPLVYVYLSIGQISAPAAEKTLAAAFAESDFDVVLAGAGHPYFEKRGEYRIGNVRFFRFLPSDEVLKQADIAVHHGGQNTTLQCIQAGVPALIYPGLHFERYYNAKKASAIGCAYNLKNEDFNPNSLLRLCRQLLERRPFQANLETYAREIRQRGGRKKAAEIILQAA
ncbi:MAG: hypothetical protein JW929_11600 [Anaerolineales bacterium]|nr:hypothetical protein [Anaerolineales bacterium]